MRDAEPTDTAATEVPAAVATPDLTPTEPDFTPTVLDDHSDDDHGGLRGGEASNGGETLPSGPGWIMRRVVGPDGIDHFQIVPTIPEEDNSKAAPGNGMANPSRNGVPIPSTQYTTTWN